MTCGIRVDVHGDGWVAPSPRRPTLSCTGVAKYAAVFKMEDGPRRVSICEKHAFEARYPKDKIVVSAVELGVLEIRSLPRDVYLDNLERQSATSALTELLAG